MATVTREQLQGIEWAGPLKRGNDVGYPDYINGPLPIQTCPLCSRERGTPHADWCWIAAALASPPAEDGGVMVRVDAMLVEQMRAGGLQGPFSRVELDESGTEPRLMLTVQREPTPDSVEWWRSVAAGLGVEIQKLKDLAAQAPPASDPPGPTVINEDDGDVTIDFDYANDRVVSIRLGEESSGLSAFVDGESHALCPLDRVPPKVLALLRTEAKAVTLRQSDPPGLVRYGVSPEWSSGPLLTPMEDGYWTPWHLAAQAITARQSDPPGLVDVVRAWQEARTARMELFKKWECDEYRPAPFDEVSSISFRMDEATKALDAYPLPASPQAETKGDK